MNLFNRNQSVSNQAISYSQMSVANSKSQRKLKAIFVLAAVAFIASLGLLSSSTNLNADTSNNPTTASSVTDKLTKLTSQTDSRKANGTAVSSTSTDSAVKNCTPSKSYLKPAQPIASSKSNSVISKPMVSSNYAVYGNNSEQINNQIYSCTPVLSDGQRFAASTDYAISWSISYKVQANGICKVTSAGVALNQSMVFPDWKASANTSAQTKKQWHSFITNLKAHETEHAQINHKYANKILGELRSLPATNCATISAEANARANSLVKSMNAANNSLDSHTNHGESTGAQL